MKPILLAASAGFLFAFAASAARVDSEIVFGSGKAATGNSPEIHAESGQRSTERQGWMVTLELMLNRLSGVTDVTASDAPGYDEKFDLAEVGSGLGLLTIWAD